MIDNELKGINKNICLDIATGTGFLAESMAAHFNKVIGFDISESQIEEAKKCFKG